MEELCTQGRPLQARLWAGISFEFQMTLPPGSTSIDTNLSSELE